MRSPESSWEITVPRWDYSNKNALNRVEWIVSLYPGHPLLILHSSELREIPSSCELSCGENRVKCTYNFALDQNARAAPILPS
jgi:hypothetical protein